MATVQLTFYIHLTDQAQVRDLQAANPGGIIRGPIPASVEFSAPHILPNLPIVAPCTTSAWPNSDKFPRDRAVFRIKSGAFFGLAGLFGVSTRYVWVGQFVYTPAGTPPTEGAVTTGTGGTVVEAMPQRRWIEGFEAHSPSGGTLSGRSGAGDISPDGSRVIGGSGALMRSQNPAMSHALLDFGTVAVNTRSWERFYLRLRRLPTVQVPIWFCTPGGGAGTERLKIYVAPTGQLLVYGVTNASVETLTGISTPLVLKEWTKWDVLLSYDIETVAGTNVNKINYRLFRNGVQDVVGGPIVRTPSVGLFHNASSLLNSTGITHDLEIDVDDWICAEWPRRFAAAAWSAATTYSIGTDVTYGGKGYTAVLGSLNQPPPGLAWAQLIGPHDWVAGSHVRCWHPTAFGAAHDAVAYPGSVTVLDKNFMAPDVGQSDLGSTTALGVCEVKVDAVSLERGAAAVVAGFDVSHASPDGTAQVGLGVNGAAPTMGAGFPAVQSTHNWASVMYRPSGVVNPADLGVIRLRFTKQNNAGAASVYSAAASVEYIGVWGREDIVPDPAAVPPINPATMTVPPRPGIHNAPYPDSPWATSTTPPLSGVQIVGGLYTGNGVDVHAALEVAVAARWPIHFWMARRVGGTGAVWWWSSMLGAHRAITTSPYPQSLSRALKDPTYVSPGTENDAEERYVARLSGNDTNSNVNAGSYQFIALMDPGSRFTLNGAFTHGGHASDATVVNPLADSKFVPTFGLFFRETLVSPLGATSALVGKGLGNAADGASVVDATETASALTFGSGALTSFASQHNQWEQVAYALMRAIEPGSTDPGVVYQISSYVGDGSASRTINLTPVSGKRPLFALIVATGGTSYMRDPSHTTTTSSPMAGGATIASGITAGGIDSMSVGSTLNANGVGYSVLVMPGSATAGNNGWSINGDFHPVEPRMPGGDQWPIPPFTEPTIDIVETPPAVVPTALPTEPDLDNTTALPGTTEHCEFFSRRLANIALSRIGVSKQIANLNTDQTEEATLARLHFKEDVEATLRDFPWPFATRYADLVLVAGTTSASATKDWQYSYRSPLGMMFARRIVGQGDQRRAYDAAPIGFREGSDASGSLIYTDAPASTAVPVTLEYTIRMTCPAYQGDALFRAALTWRLAHSLAATLSKDGKKQAYAWAMYVDALRTAEAAAANESQKPPGGDADWIQGRN